MTKEDLRNEFKKEYDMEYHYYPKNYWHFLENKLIELHKENEQLKTNLELAEQQLKTLNAF